jgi:hypothetical protein
VTALVVPLGLVFGWWIAGIVLVQVAGVTLLSFEGHLRRGMSRATLLRLGLTVASFATGAVLFFANGGFGGFRGESDRERVTRYVEAVSHGRVLGATKVAEDEIGPCDYRVWDVRTTKGRWWAVSVKGRRAGLPVAVYRHGEFASAAKLISFRVEENRRLADELAKVLGKRARSLPPAC